MADIIKNLPTDSSTKEEVIQNVHINTPGSEEKIRKTLKKDEDRRKIIPYDNEDNNNVVTINSIDNFRDISWINPIKIKKGFIYRSATPWEINEKELEMLCRYEHGKPVGKCWKKVLGGKMFENNKNVLESY